jgi:hypothetical protein
LSKGEAVTMPNPQGSTMIISPTILKVEGERKLSWLDRTEGDALKVEHSFIIKPTSEENVHCIQREKFTGSMVSMLEEWLDIVVRKYFEDMNKALKDRTEAM